MLFIQMPNKERCENFCIIQATDFRKESAAMARAHCRERKKGGKNVDLEKFLHSGRLLKK
jgi:hypothetical protein